MCADLAVLVLLVKRDPRLAAGSGQTRRIDDVREVFASPSIAPNWCTAVNRSSSTANFRLASSQDDSELGRGHGQVDVEVGTHSKNR